MTFAFPMFSDAFEFSQEPGRRVTWDMTIGQEIPIVVIENFTPSTPVSGRWGVGLWTAISFHVLEEFKDPSAPIINTDYRFSLATLKFRRVQRSIGGLGENHADYLDLKADLYHHESTHLGDEFVLGQCRKGSSRGERLQAGIGCWRHRVDPREIPRIAQNRIVPALGRWSLPRARPAKPGPELRARPWSPLRDRTARRTEARTNRVSEDVLIQ